LVRPGPSPLALIDFAISRSRNDINDNLPVIEVSDLANWNTQPSQGYYADLQSLGGSIEEGGEK
jgi:hypothetical protein